MSLFHSKEKSSAILWVTVCTLLLFSYAALVFAVGPFAPGATLDPIGDYGTGVCSSPTDVTCYVTTGWSLNTVSGYVYSATGDLVGIGDSTPTYKLDVNGDIAIGATAGTSAYKLYNSSIAGVADVIKFVNGSNLFLGAYNDGTGIAGAGITSGTNNIAIGSEAGEAIISGTRNIYLGIGAGKTGSADTDNIFIGYSAGTLANGGVSNVSIGSFAGDNITTGDANILIGYNAGGAISSGGSNTFVGYNSGGNGSSNAVLGAEAGRSTGSNNAFLGYGAGALMGGNNNTFLGYAAGDTMTSGSDNIIIGASVDAVSATGSSQLNIGNTLYGDLANDYVGIGSDTGGTVTPAFALDVKEDRASSYAAKILNDGDNLNRFGALVSAGADSGDGTLIQFNDGDGTDVGEITFSGTTTTYGTSSDRRMKDNIVETHYDLEDLLDIEVKDFTFTTEDSGRVYTGFIAQDLIDIYPDAVFAPDDGRMWSVDYGKITPLIVAAVQELAIDIQDVDARAQRLLENETFLGGLRAWFADAANGITELFAGKITTSELCVDDVCVTRDEFRALLQANNISASGNNSEEQEEEVSTQEEEEQSEPLEEESTENSTGESEVIEAGESSETNEEQLNSETESTQNEEGSVESEEGSGENTSGEPEEVQVENSTSSEGEESGSLESPDSISP